MAGDLKKIIKEALVPAVHSLVEEVGTLSPESILDEPSETNDVEQVYVVLYFENKTIREPDGASLNFDVESSISVHSTLEDAESKAKIQNLKYSIISATINGAPEEIKKL